MDESRSSVNVCQDLDVETFLRLFVVSEHIVTRHWWHTSLFLQILTLLNLGIYQCT